MHVHVHTTGPCPPPPPPPPNTHTHTHTHTLPGEAMEKGLRDCCHSMRIGKILIRRDQESRQPRVYYAKFPPQIDKRQILLLLPVLGKPRLSSQGGSQGTILTEYLLPNSTQLCQCTSEHYTPYSSRTNPENAHKLIGLIWRF